MKTPKAVKLPSGAWRCRVRIDGQDISITKPTEKAAIAEAMAIKAGVKQAAIRQPELTMTLTAAITAYIERRQNILSPATVAGYEAIQRGRFATLMPLKLTVIDDMVAQRAVNTEAKLCSAKTLTNSWRFVASVLRDGGAQVPAVRLPRVQPKPRPYLTPDQIPIFCDAIRGKHLEVPALLALSSLRRSEILALTPDSIDYKAKTISVSGAAVIGPDGKLVYKSTNKTAASVRTVPMIQQLEDALLRNPPAGKHLVSYSPNAIYTGVNRICAKHGLPQVGVHGLRHSFASLCYSLGIPEHVCMQLGGWDDYTTMHKIYTHIANSDVVKGGAQFVNFFAPPKNDHETDHAETEDR